MFNVLLGLGVYPEKDKAKKIIAYIDLAEQHGFKALFVNLLGALSNKKELAAISAVCNHASNKNWRVTADISPAALANLGLQINTPGFERFFKDLGVNTLRLDEDFGGELEASFTKMSNKLALQVNASMFTNIALKMKQKGADLGRVTACHNFYPQRETGLSWDYFEEANLDFLANGIKVEAFLSLPARATYIGPWDSDAGLPTLELQRDRSISYQTRFLCAGGSVSALHVGAMYARAEEMATIAKYAKDEIGLEAVSDHRITKVERSIVYGYDEHVARGDIAENMVRSTTTRVKFKDKAIPPRKFSGKRFECGDIVVVNDALPRYKGELQIITGSIENDGTRNLVARLPKDELDLLLYMRPWRKFTIYERKS